MASNTEKRSEIINPIIILPKGNLVMLAVEARNLNSKTDIGQYSRSLEPLGSLILQGQGNWPQLLYTPHVIQ